MRAPLSWIKDFVDIPASVTAEQISDGLIRVGFEVEEIIKQGADLSGPLKFAKVLSIEEITEFKKPIRYVGLDCGEGETRYVICGATNFAVGDLVVAALPGAVLPGEFKIGARETYGKTSNGMICSARELGISDDHAGIMVFAEKEVTIGADAIEALQIFKNVKRRMECIGIKNGITIYDDFAHHPAAISTTLAGLRAKVGKARIIAVLEPRSNTMKLGTMKSALPESLKDADQVFCYGEKLTWNAEEALAPIKNKSFVGHDMKIFVDAILKEIKSGDHILVMSNGSFNGIHQTLLKGLV